MGKIQHYILKPNTTTKDIIKAGAKQGGKCVNKDATRFLYAALDDDISVTVAFGDDLTEWNEVDWVLVMDESFGQPYTTFYLEFEGAYRKQNKTLDAVIKAYNKFMDETGLFVKQN